MQTEQTLTDWVMHVTHSTPVMEHFIKLYRGVFSTIYVAFLNCDWFWSTDQCRQWINILSPDCSYKTAERAFDRTASDLIPFLCRHRQIRAWVCIEMKKISHSYGYLRPKMKLLSASNWGLGSQRNCFSALRASLWSNQRKTIVNS